MSFASRRLQSLAGLSALTPFDIAGILAVQSKLACFEQQQRGVITRPRWYDKVEVTDRGPWAGFQISLDGRALRTPAKHPLLLPTRLLAAAIAAEWQWQESGKLRPHTMPLMTLAATALDQPKSKEDVIETLLGFLDTDGLCCRSKDPSVSERQSKVLNPILQRAGQRLGADFTTSSSIFGSPQSDAAAIAVQNHLAGLDHWRLAATDSLSAACKSVLMGISVTQGWLTMHEALEAASLEESINIEGWGLVEGGHDIDAADLRVRISAPCVFARLLTLT
ncbi:hypothetical protein WJX73_004730 [Symbiochloris irregularis]|uniref:ATP synthase mitochondrial F1 complex assembly factor 2 n=1 Tax=Symbiochloris irregularis TaxID=706552 RepID=A0AAW1PZR7_9CHLO